MRKKISWPQAKEILKKGYGCKVEFKEPTDWQSKVMRRVRQCSENLAEMEIPSINGFVFRLGFASLFICLGMQIFDWTYSESNKMKYSGQFEDFVPEYSPINLLWGPEL